MGSLAGSMMDRIEDLEIHPTGDKSPTLYSSRFSEIYHSRHGAFTESMHVFIRHGLEEKIREKPGMIRVGEMGLGTCLNAALAFQYAETKNADLQYHAIEAFPPDLELLQRYSSLLPPEISNFHQQVVNLTAGLPHILSSQFSIHWEKSRWPVQGVFKELDVFFYDAFSPDKQPELWMVDAFRTAYDSMSVGGILVTYCSKGYVRRNLQEAGFQVERLPGPPGKREMLRARRLV
jgi:tRNA U34 5-methylaminomethyl-2-thiouridine-forming methyltransferase MnmC